MKKLLALCLSLAMLCTLAACSGSDENTQDTTVESTVAEDTSTEEQESAEQPIDDADGDTDVNANDTSNVEEDAEETAIAEEPFVFDASAESAFEATFTNAHLNITQSQVLFEIAGIDAPDVDEALNREGGSVEVGVTLFLDDGTLIGSLDYSNKSDGNSVRYTFFSDDLSQTDYIEVELQLVEYSAEKIVFGANWPDASTLDLEDFAMDMYDENGYDFSDVVKATYYLCPGAYETADSVTF